MNWELTGEITHQETFAEGSKIRELHRLIDAYGGKNWKKRKGFAPIRMLTSGEISCGITLVRGSWHRQS